MDRRTGPPHLHRRHLSVSLWGVGVRRRTSVRRIVTFGLLALAVPVVAAGQTKDDFAYWDANRISRPHGSSARRCGTPSSRWGARSRAREAGSGRPGLEGRVEPYHGATRHGSASRGDGAGVTRPSFLALQASRGPEKVASTRVQHVLPRTVGVPHQVGGPPPRVVVTDAGAGTVSTTVGGPARPEWRSTDPWEDASDRTRAIPRAIRGASPDYS